MSRPKTVMNHGMPAAGRLPRPFPPLSRSEARSATERGKTWSRSSQDARSLGTRRFQAASDASMRSRSSPKRCLAMCGRTWSPSERRDDVEAELPRLPGLELDPVPDLPGLDVPALGQDHLRSREPGVVVEHELVLVLLVTRLGGQGQGARLERVAESEVVVLDREDVREVAGELDRELERDLLRALVLHAEVVLHALADEAVLPIETVSWGRSPAVGFRRK